MKRHYKIFIKPLGRCKQKNFFYFSLSSSHKNKTVTLHILDK